MSDVVPDVGRHAVLVDAGYLYASVGQLVLGRTTRREFRVATEPLIGALLDRADRTMPGRLLRMYWYDAARDRVPTVEQRQIAALPNVKVRLGNLNSAGQQKGVDAQLRQDLELLAKHRAVSDVVLIAGDEDMVPAVEAAQAYGVRVHVWGVEPPYGVNQAERLVWEADTVDQLDAEFCRPYVEVEPAAVEETLEPGPREEKHAVPTPADVFAARKLAAPPSKPAAAMPVVTAAHDRPGPERPEMEQIGARIAARWLLTRGRENVADLLPGPVLPTVIDKELLVEAEEEISRSLRPYEEARRALRDGFWAKLHREFGIQPASVPPHPTPDRQPATPPAPAATSDPAAAASGPAVPGQPGPGGQTQPAPAASGSPPAAGPAVETRSVPGADQGASSPAGASQPGQGQFAGGATAPGGTGPAGPGQPGPGQLAGGGATPPGGTSPAGGGQPGPGQLAGGGATSPGASSRAGAGQPTPGQFAGADHPGAAAPAGAGDGSGPDGASPTSHPSAPATGGALHRVSADGADPDGQSPAKSTPAHT